MTHHEHVDVNVLDVSYTFFNVNDLYKRQMNENDDNEKNIKFYHMHVHPRNDS